MTRLALVPALLCLLIASTALPLGAIAPGSSVTLWLDTEEDSSVCDQGRLRHAAPAALAFGCARTPSTVYVLGRYVSRVSHEYLLESAFGSAVTLGDDASLYLQLYHPIAPAWTHPFLEANATLHLVSGATVTPAGSGAAGCASLVSIGWDCTIPIALTADEIPAGDLLRLTVTWTQDNNVFSPYTAFGANESRLTLATT